jgi:hypothetical protein
MTLSKLYASLVLPLLFGLATKLVLCALAVPLSVTFFSTLAVVLLLWLLGDEVENYCFREVYEGWRDRMHRGVWFALFLPGVYATTLAIWLFPYLLFALPVWSGLLPAVATLLTGLWYLGQDNHHRGARLYRQSYAAALAYRGLRPGERTVPMGGVPVPVTDLCHNVAFIGSIGSGKTTAIKQILPAVIPLIGKSKESLRAVVYDPKTEFYGYLSALASCPVWSLHPLDSRGKSWDMAKSITTPMAEHQFAVSLIPVVEGPNAFFSNSARAILETVVRSFNLSSPGKWIFADLIYACESPKRLRAILSRHEATRSCVEQYLDAREASSILSELDTHLRPFRPIAACWSRAELVNLDDFVQGNAVMILPMHRKARDQLTLLNGLVFDYVSQLLLAQQTNVQRRAAGLPERQTFVFIDEIRDIAKRLPDLKTFFTLGRAFGISNIIGYQSQEGLKEALDQNRAPELLGQCLYKGLLAVNETETAEYCSRMCGDKEVYRKSPGGEYRIEEKRVVMPVAFSQLGRDLFRGYYIGPQPLGLWKSELPWPHHQAGTPPTEPDFIPRPDEHEILLPWTLVDLERLKLPPALLQEGTHRGEEFKETKLAPEQERQEQDLETGFSDGQEQPPGTQEPGEAASARPKKLVLVKRRDPQTGEVQERNIAVNE